MFSSFFLFFLLFFNVKSIKIPMSSNIDNFIINIFINENEYIPMIFNTGIEKSLIAAENCSICKGGKYLPSSSSQLLKENITQNLSHFIYRGDEYLQDFYLYSYEIYKLKLDYINFYDIKYKEETNIEGIFSLNFVNFNIETEKKIFAIEYTNEGAYLDVGEINKNIVDDYSKLINFTVCIKNNSNENNSNIEWFLQAKNLKINNEQMPIENPKIILDTFSYNFYIPKKFFFDNIDKIFPKKSRCQVQMSGTFICKCDENYKNYFSNFVFEFENGNKLFVNTTDYISYDSSITGTNCFVYIIVNYNNDYFIAGNNVLNNYYSIFNVDEKILSFYPLNNSNEKLQILLMFIIISILSLVVFFGSYYLYRKYLSNFRNEFNNLDNIEEAIHHE